MLLVFSAANSAAVQRMVHSFNDYYTKCVLGVDNRLESLAYTLAAYRSIMPWNTFAVTGLHCDLLEGRVQNGHGTSSSLKTGTPIRSSADKPTAAFVFTGQGAQYVGMGKDLMRYTVFEQSFKRSDVIMARFGSRRPLFGTYYGNSSPFISK